jgi:hypothetical protein
VPILNPEHLFEQAEKLTLPPPAGPPRQVDLRRAISSAYYGLFHAILTAAADEYVGVTKRSTAHYSLLYRSVSHGTLKSLCLEVKRPNLTPKYVPYAPNGGFDANIKTFATAVVELQEKRHGADYDPLIRVKTADAQLIITIARSALDRFATASAVQRKAFLTLLLFPPLKGTSP